MIDGAFVNITSKRLRKIQIFIHLFETNLLISLADIFIFLMESDRRFDLTMLRGIL